MLRRLNYNFFFKFILLFYLSSICAGSEKHVETERNQDYRSWAEIFDTLWDDSYSTIMYNEADATVNNYLVTETLNNVRSISDWTLALVTLISIILGVIVPFAISLIHSKRIDAKLAIVSDKVDEVKELKIQMDRVLLISEKNERKSNSISYIGEIKSLLFKANDNKSIDERKEILSNIIELSHDYKSRYIELIALAHDEKEIDVHRNNSTILNQHVAIAYMQLGDIIREYECEIQAFDYYDSAIKNDSRLLVGYNNRGLCYLKMSKSDEAIKDFDKALSLMPNFAPAYANRAAAKKSKNDLPGYYNDLCLAIQFNPHDVEALNNRGVYKIERGDKKGAIEDFNEAIKINNFALAYGNLSIFYLSEGNADKALQMINRGIENNPQNADLYMHKGNICIAKKDYTEAITNYKKSYSIDSLKTANLNNIAMTYMEMEKYDEAIATFDQLILEEREPTKSYLYRAKAKYKKGNYIDSYHDLDKFSDYEPDNSELYYYVAKIHIQLKSSPQALLAINEAIKRDASQMNYYTLKGAIYIDLNRLDKAKENFDYVEEHDPSCESLYEKRAVYYEIMAEKETCLKLQQEYRTLALSDRENLSSIQNSKKQLQAN